MRWQRPAGLATFLDDDVLWVLTSSQGRIVRLDVVGATIWECAIGASSADAVIDDLARTNDWEPHVIREHVVNFIDDLVARGLLERCES